jgi:Concanavalin A-like lectin/glucanases superfamily/Calcineurin-like phosphoesterase
MKSVALAAALLFALPASLLLAEDSEGPPPINAGTATGKELTSPPVRDSFTFLLFGDRTTGRTPGLKVLDRAIEVANRLDPDFVLTIGDMVQGYTVPARWLAQMREYQEHIKALRPPWYPVAGNHDVLGGKSNRPGNAALYAEHFAPLYYSFDYRWGHFVCLWSEESVSPTSPTGGGRVSEEQIAWLEKDLAQTKAEQVFVFLHHPRWLSRGANWPRVHGILAADGRTKAVFAGHLHQYRDDGVRDGIHYYVVAVTGGGQGHFPETAGLHHLHHVRVRRDGFRISVLPLGTVVGSDAVLGSELDRMYGLARGTWLNAAGTVDIPFDGETRAEIRAVLANPSDREAAYTLRLDLPEGYIAEPAELAATLGPGERLEETVLISGPGFTGALPRIRVAGTLFFKLASGLVQPIHHARTVPVRLRGVPKYRRTSGSPEGVLSLDGKSAIRLPAIEPEGPFTMECWVKGPPPGGRHALLARTERSSFGLYWCYDKEQLPYVAFGLAKVPGGKGAGYLYLRAKKAWDFEKWTHLALDWDGEVARFFVNGRLEEERPAPGPRTQNRLPLFVGADPDNKGNPGCFFKGSLDETRISAVSRYRREFKPKRVFRTDRDTLLLLHFDRDDSRFFADDSTRENHGWPVGNPLVLREER